MADFAVAAEDDVGAEGAAGAVGCVFLLADEEAALGTGDRGRGQDGAEDGCSFHSVGKVKHPGIGQVMNEWWSSCSV